MAKKKVDLEIVEPNEVQEKEKGAKHRPFRPGGRPLWNGSISFGLVNVPVHMVPAVRQNDLRFHLLHEKDNARLKRKYVCSVEEKEVPADEIKKGYEVSPNRHVIMEPKELEALAPKASRHIDLLYFVRSDEIDPIYFERPYYLIPDAQAEKAYCLLRDAMKEAGRTAISEIIVRGKEYLAAVRPTGHVLALDTMRFPSEIIFPSSLSWKSPSIKISDRELKAARDLVNSLEGKFEPQKLHDDYRELVLKAIDRKAKGNKVVVTPEQDQEEDSQVIDLMAALEKSLKSVSTRKAKARSA
jgi:DNA end-binding protein Ku